MKRHTLQYALPIVLVVCGLSHAQVDVTATVTLGSRGNNGRMADSNNVVLWLTPLDPLSMPAPAAAQHPKLVQKNKSFEPHVLVVPVGTLVEFPNRDPFFHNVFSLFDGKRFDLGLYEAGSTRNVLFDKPGVSYIFCNIHPEMSAVVIALNSPYYGISDRKGQVKIPRVQPGRYMLRVWYEAVPADALNAMAREVTVDSRTPTLAAIHLPAPGNVPPHKNMYGHDYSPPTPDGSIYIKP
jgi:plastocyanin